MWRTSICQHIASLTQDYPGKTNKSNEEKNGIRRNMAKSEEIVQIGNHKDLN